MKQLTKEELDAMAWMDEAGIVFDADLMEMASRNWRNRNERYAEERRRRNAFDGVIVASVMSLLFWTPLLAYIFRKPILHFFGVGA